MYMAFGKNRAGELLKQAEMMIVYDNIPGMLGLWTGEDTAVCFAMKKIEQEEDTGKTLNIENAIITTDKTLCEAGAGKLI